MTHDIHGLHRPEARDNVVLLTEVGSDLHGVSVDNQDDKDLMGVYLEPPKYRLGLSELPHDVKRWHEDGTPIPDGERSGPGDTDSTLYSMRKFVHLASEGNPTVLMPLFAPPDKVYHLDGPGDWLRISKGEFITKKAGKKFLGYCRGQYAQMIDEKGKHTNRPELIAQFGFDTKFAYHALRLAIQGKEMLTTGDITLPMKQHQREFIQDVRIGVFSKGVVTDILEDLINDLSVAVDNFDGPDMMLRDDVDRFLRNVYLMWWDSKGLI
jgi:predicted nucleotidyltransferase